MLKRTKLRAFLLVVMTLVFSGQAAYAGHHGHALKKKIHEAHQAHAHKKKMKHAMHDACKSQKEHHHLLHHHKLGGH